ncbi:hypothetical protein HWV62_39928 [Athelia sp. TMB]|nr:hypothetical protein HWV62_39928 [Athelia sp. TMB]
MTREYKTCASCRERDAKAKAEARKRKRQEAAVPPARPAPQLRGEILNSEGDQTGGDRDGGDRPDEPRDDESGTDDDDDDGTTSKATEYSNSKSLFEALRTSFASSQHVAFHGTFKLPEDPLITPRERVQMIVHDIWRVTGYRFTVKDHPKIKSGHKTRLWCCQDEGRKKKRKPRKGVNIKHRDHVGMTRFPCRSQLIVTCARADGGNRVTIRLRHHENHVTYYDVELPDGAAQIIRENIEWSTPNGITPKVQAAYPQVTGKQVHYAWTEMSETLWRRGDMQLPSAKILLGEYPEDVDVFNIPVAEGVEQLCWGMKKISERLRGKVVEIGIDATCELLQELVINGASATHIGKRTQALKAWAKCLRDTYGVDPKFVHSDKDMAEINMARDVWIAKIQLCWWHLREAVLERLKKGKLSTSPYNAQQAHAEFRFIDPTFTPYGRADPNEHEGGVDNEFGHTSIVTEGGGPNAISLRIPIPSHLRTPSAIPADGALAEISNVHINATPPAASATEATALQRDQGSGAVSGGSMQSGSRFIIQLPARTMMDSEGHQQPEDSVSGGKDSKHTKRTFCTAEHRQPIIDLIEAHLCAHPLIPGYSAPSPEGIREWAVKQTYQYCAEHDLREVWAYLWQNWYRPGRWELWARSVCPEIPVLRTTMMLESHWRRIKKDFLHHFHKPRIDLLVWVLVVKLAPTYYRKLDQFLTTTGRFRELAAWRKGFKREWRRLKDTPIALPLNPKYRPDPCKWVCTCPYFVKSRFLVCKHVIQSVHDVPPIFFLEVKRRRTLPIWQHPKLVPLVPRPHAEASAAAGEPLSPAPGNETIGSHAMSPAPENDNPDADDDDDDDDAVDTQIGQWAGGQTLRESFLDEIQTIRDFCDGLEYQVQFEDRRMLETLQREGASFLRLARSCLGRERRYNSTRGAAPTTWEKATASAMFYRTRPPPRDAST